MNKIIILFFILFFKSEIVFSSEPYEGFSSNFSSFQPELYSHYQQYIGEAVPCSFLSRNETTFSSTLKKDCFLLGWLTTTVANVAYSDSEGSYSSVSAEFPISPRFCPFSSTSSIIRVRFISSNREYCDAWTDYNPICLSDFGTESISTQHFLCGGTGFCSSATFSTLYACSVLPPLDGFISEKTLQTTNALISESNSKLGSIATSNAINSNLLSQISQGISNLFSDSSSSSNTDTDTTDTTDSTTIAETCFGIEVVGGCSNLGFDVSGDFSLDSVSFDVSSISPNSALANSQSSCPPDYSFSALNRSYSISYLPFCDLATRLRSIVIPAARVAAAWIVIGAL